MAFEAEVERGIALLDEQVPGWRDKVDVGRLDMVWASAQWRADGCCCVGGQLADDGEGYYQWASQLSGFDSVDERDRFDEWAYRHGFQVPFAESYPDLTDAWKRALTPDGAP